MVPARTLSKHELQYTGRSFRGANGTIACQPQLPQIAAWNSRGPPLVRARLATARQDGQRLLGYRDARSGRACLVFGSDSDTCSDSNEWHRLFGDHALLKLASGVGPTADGQVAVFGLARSSVVTVELRDGDTVVNTTPVTNGGWVIVAPQGEHKSVVGLDRNGKPVETLDARNWSWKFCFKESGCP